MACAYLPPEGVRVLIRFCRGTVCDACALDTLVWLLRSLCRPFPAAIRARRHLPPPAALSLMQGAKGMAATRIARGQSIGGGGRWRNNENEGDLA